LAGTTPKLNTISPYWLEDLLVQRELIYIYIYIYIYCIQIGQNNDPLANTFSCNSD
jgi:hypothetical protein